MGRKNKQDDFEIIVPIDNDAEIKRTKILDTNNVLNRLNNLKRNYKVEYDNLVSWVYNEFKSTTPCSDPEHVYKIPLISVLKHLPSDRFHTLLDMLKQCENTVEFNNNFKTVAETKMKKEEPEEILSRSGHIFPSDRGFGDIEEKSVAPVLDYVSFTIANYALTDVLEELTAAKVKDIIVTKEDDNLVVKYKPSWRA